MFTSPNLSLQDIVGKEYVNRVSKSVKAINIQTCDELIDKKVDFYPTDKQKTNQEWVKRVGSVIAEPFDDDQPGASTDAYRKALDSQAAPLTGFGCYRVGENGKLYFLGKSEHYHTPLGHRFAGYQLIDYARRLGILNPTHNNTRGYITRLTEYRLIESVNGLTENNTQKMTEILSSVEPKVLNRVINLETGSLAVEAGVKMMLNRFFALDSNFAPPKYHDKIPVFFIMADQDGGLTGNYHGTTVFTQTFRGLWPELRKKADDAGLYKVVPVAINDVDDFEKKIRYYNKGGYKTAGFLHEIILMNYGGIRLEPSYLQKAYELCRQTDTPVLVDEIQSCMWYKGMFLFRLYGLTPDFVIIGKGFPGGEYAASKIITTAEMDTLNQFGALVTNGQEELASLSYLITMEFAKANGALIDKLGEEFHAALTEVQRRHSNTICKIEGQGHLTGIHFQSVKQAADFAHKLNQHCIDASAQIYKPNCPPAVLLKPPIIASEKELNFLVRSIENLI